MIYVASVYSKYAHSYDAKSLALREKRFMYTAKRVGEFMEQAAMDSEDNCVYSPIVHCHVPATLHRLPKDYKFWQSIDRHMIEKADALWVLKMPLWEISSGVQDEIAYAKSLGKEVYYFDCPDYKEDETEYDKEAG